MMHVPALMEVTTSDEIPTERHVLRTRCTRVSDQESEMHTGVTEALNGLSSAKRSLGELERSNAAQDEIDYLQVQLKIKQDEVVCALREQISELQAHLQTKQEICTLRERISDLQQEVHAKTLEALHKKCRCSSSRREELLSSTGCSNMYTGTAEHGNRREPSRSDVQLF
jgi:chromosome condensin MukBEF ATPase and DNA-binding subunit MukB